MTNIHIIGVPMDLGQARRGVDMGPSALRYAGLSDRLRRIGCTISDQGNIETPVRDTLPAEGGLAFLPAVIQVCEAIYLLGRQAIAADCLPIFIGGDHSTAAGTLGGVTDQKPAGVLWIDAHGDFNTPETSPSGNLHGMPLATLLGFGIPEWVNVGRAGSKLEPSQVVLVGTHDLDPQEREAIKASGLTIYTMREIDEQFILNHPSFYTRSMTMKVIRKDEGQVRQGTTFTNTAHLNTLLPAQQEDGLRLILVTFEDGAVTHWHVHPGEQVLYILAGDGRVGNETEVIQVSAGDVVYTGPGEKHWHGAAPGRSMTHMSITTVGPPTWYDEAPDPGD